MENHKEKQSIVQAQLTKSTSTGKLTKPDVQSNSQPLLYLSRETLHYPGRFLEAKDVLKEKRHGY